MISTLISESGSLMSLNTQKTHKKALKPAQVSK